MRYTIKSKRLLTLSVAVLAATALFAGLLGAPLQTAYAVTSIDCPDGTAVSAGSGSSADMAKACQNHQKKMTQTVDCGGGVTAERMTGQSAAQACASSASNNVAVTTPSPSAPSSSGNTAPVTDNSCGGRGQVVPTSIDLGCRHKGNPIIDMLFAVIRLLSNGVGLVIIGSIIVGGIQYTMSAGDPQAAAKAIGRIRATIIALGIYIFAYPLLNYVIPSGFIK